MNNFPDILDEERIDEYLACILYYNDVIFQNLSTFDKLVKEVLPTIIDIK